MNGQYIASGLHGVKDTPGLDLGRYVCLVVKLIVTEIVVRHVCTRYTNVYHHFINIFPCNLVVSTSRVHDRSHLFCLYELIEFRQAFLPSPTASSFVATVIGLCAVFTSGMCPSQNHHCLSSTIQEKIS